MSSTVTTLKSAWAHASSKNASLMAAGVAFYAFLALFPALIAGVLSYGLFASAETVQRQSAQLTDAMPADAASLVSGQLESLASTSSGSLGFGLVLAIVLALYSASGGASNLLTALESVFGDSNERNFIQAKAVALGLTAAAVFFGIVVLTLVAVTPIVFDALDLPGFARILGELVRWVLLIGAVVVAVSALFRVAHPAAADEHRKLRLGVVVAAALFLVASLGFSLYVDLFGSYAKTYGALAGVVALLLWLWIGIYALLLGASVEVADEEETEPVGGIDAD